MSKEQRQIIAKQRHLLGSSAELLPDYGPGTIAKRDSKIKFFCKYAKEKIVLDLGCVQHNPKNYLSRYWMHKAHHNVYAHYGVRTSRYKLIYYYADALGQTGAIDETYEPEWELFDLETDPHEMNNIVDNPDYVDIVVELKAELHRLQTKLQDERYPLDKD